MAAGGVPATGYGITPTPYRSPLSTFGNPASFTAAAGKQASDYDAIMQSYRDFISSNSNNPNPSSLNVSPKHINYQSEIIPQNITMNLTPYQESSDVKQSLSNLSDLSTTGGLSEADKADIRARDISPIRSIYANAQRNVDRQRALQGGYSPNYGAVSAKMSRDLADEIASKTTDVNAGIEQMVQQGKLSAAPQYASAASSEAARKTQADQFNADLLAKINEFNSQQALGASEFNASNRLGVDEANANRQLEADTGNVNRQLSDLTRRSGLNLDAIRGMQSLYGTTPALTSLFGQQALGAGQLGQNQQVINNQKDRDLLGFISQFR